MSAEHGRWLAFCQLTTGNLLTLTLEFTEELRRRAEATEDIDQKRALYLALARSTEARAHLRQLLMLEASAAPASAAKAASATPTPPRGAGAAEISPPAADSAPLCERCKLDVGHEGPCRPVEGAETGPLPQCPRSAHPAAAVARAEGADRENGAEGDGRTSSSDGGRGEPAKPTDLGYHLALLKGGIA